MKTVEKKIGIKIEPLDVLFFRDGKPFGVGLRGNSGFPMPQTLAGALRTAFMKKYGCDFDKFAALLKESGNFENALSGSGAPKWIANVRFSGPFLARTDGKTEIEPLVPIPSVIQESKENEEDLLCLKPLKERLPGWKPREDGMKPLWLKSKFRFESAKGYLTLEGLRVFLSGGEPKREHIVRVEDLYGFEYRTGIGIDTASLVAAEGQIYGASFIRLNEKVCFYAEMILPDSEDDLLTGIEQVSLGGEGKRVKISKVGSIVDWGEKRPPYKPNEKPLLVLTTPAIFECGWRPRCLSGKLVSASVSGYDAVSGWDLARRGPKRTRFAAKAGSVYFLNEEVEDLPVSLADSEEDRIVGWGSYLKGVWKDE
jgi:CRISPR-associated protein Cmr3